MTHETRIKDTVNMEDLICLLATVRTLNKEIQEICNWFHANKLSVNASKTNYMVLGTHHSTRKFIDINQDIDILTDSESSGSRDV